MKKTLLAKTPIVIAVIGGIASGKSTVSETFQSLGASLISADEIVKKLYSPGAAIYQKLLDHFGPTIISANGRINRNALKKMILSSPQAKADLDALVHPRVQAAIHQEIQNSCSPLVVVEIPLLKNRKDYPDINTVVLVQCDPKEQLRRLMHRNHLNQEEAQGMIHLGISPAIQEGLADIIIDTTHLTPEELLKRVQKIKMYKFS